MLRSSKQPELTHSWEFIHRLPKGLDTMLTEDSLSQGQKQLLCITRVMLCLPPMLILDEATSSIDTRTELQIQEAFERMMEGRTELSLLTVSHHPQRRPNPCDERWKHYRTGYS